MSEDRIIFRGMTKSGEWLTGSPMLYAKGEYAQIWEEGTTNNYLVRPDTLSQYTGLKDANGTRIFEGDIVNYNGTLHEVVFERSNGAAYFGIKVSDIETWPFGGETPANKMTIVGNRYEGGVA